MFTFEIQHQQQYSRSELLLRSFFGWLYIGIPHGLLLCLVSLAWWFMAIAAFFIILFSGTTPQWYFDWTVKMQRWALRVSARLYNLVDGYPEFGMEGKDDKTNFNLEFWQISRGELLMRFFLGWIYAGIPHAFILYFRVIATCFLIIFSFFSVLFTGNYPADWHRFNTGTLRWAMRLNLFLSWLYKNYPPFSGMPDQQNRFDFEEKEG
jgi:hypothetical protein